MSTPDTDDLTHRIIGLAMRVHEAQLLT